MTLTYLFNTDVTCTTWCNLSGDIFQTELERVNNELDINRQENKVLHEKLKVKFGDSGQSNSSGSSMNADMAALASLTRKLEDASKLYDRVKKELTQLKQV